jgi:oligoribonuclease NrnB/cAMP/cGMP phosphodiesterase (DHH superfamily)
MINDFVFYHDHCTDGYGAAWAAWSSLGDKAEYVPVRYDQVKTLNDLGNLTKNPLTAESTVYVLDFSFPLEVMDELARLCKHVVWLDHHKTAFEMLLGQVTTERFTLINEKQTYILDNSMSGALLAWHYFNPNTTPEEVPYIIQHIDDRDRWQFKLPASKAVHTWLATHKPWSFEKFSDLVWNFEMLSDYRDTAVAVGNAILSSQEQQTKSLAHKYRKCNVAGNQGFAVNSSVYASELGHELANASGTFGMVYFVDSGNRIGVSLRSNGEYDVSAIAKQFGGGGHRNAAGFSTTFEQLQEFLK